MWIYTKAHPSKQLSVSGLWEYGGFLKIYCVCYISFLKIVL